MAKAATGSKTTSVLGGGSGATPPPVEGVTAPVAGGRTHPKKAVAGFDDVTDEETLKDIQKAVNTKHPGLNGKRIGGETSIIDKK